MRRAWLAVATLTLAAPDGRAQDVVEVDAKIVLAVDTSRSMDLDEISLQREGYLAVLRHPGLARAISAGSLGRVALAYFEWAGHVQDGGLVPWRIVDSPASAAALADEIAGMPVRRGRGTSISRAIRFGTVLLEDDRITAPRLVIDISGDGANNTGPAVTEARDEAVAKGITINGLPILAFEGGAPPNLDLYYQDCVAGGDGAFVMVARERDDLARTIHRKLVLEISGVAPPLAIMSAQFEPIDCLMGEKSFGRWNR